MTLFDQRDSELVIGIISPIGTDTRDVISHLTEHLKKFQYDAETINVSSDVLSSFDTATDFQTEYARIIHYIGLGNAIRSSTKDNSILMKGVASFIYGKRNQKEPSPKKRTAYIIKSIKHPAEITYLRRLYGGGFHLLGVTSNLDTRLAYLTQQKDIDEILAKELLARDANETIGHGQHTQDAFQESDYFIVVGDSKEKLKNSIYRLIDLLFGDPFITPSFDEYAMFMAYAASLRSADLSRQIGAVIAKNDEVLSYGANDCPKVNGGLYWPLLQENGKYIDEDDGRDYMMGCDSNKIEQQKIIDNILKAFDINNSPENIDKVKKAGISNLTEYGRVVHGEMEAILMCSRNNIACKGASLYATTFPCHNCAKHIIAAGISCVVYIEPYPKSKALEFYKNEITENTGDASKKVLFRPFVGVGPHRYVDLFSVSSFMWEERVRKDKDGYKKEWKRENTNLRTTMQLFNYIELEEFAYKNFTEEVAAFNKEE